MRSILLVSPDFEIESFWISEEEGVEAEILNDLAPLGLATIAAMIPESYSVDIWDEVVHGRIDSQTKFKRDYDLVGITGYNNHYLRSVEIAKFFRSKDTLVVVGGPGVSGMPERYREYCDVLFIGEAERTWPEFLRDWDRGEIKPEYRQIEKIDLSESPLPKWESISSDMGKYAMGGVQTRRGCPYDCEFCDVIYLFGRKVRKKPVQSVVEEIKTLERLGVSHVMFCDDEFIGNPKYTKELLRALIPLNNSFARPLTYITQVSMNISKDDEILELMADLNFSIIFIGIETPNQESLRETGKFHNIRKDLVADVKKILSYGIAVRAGLIVGFDHDTTDIFDIQDRFIHGTGLPSATLSMLKAIPGTRLWRRLRQEGRVLDVSKLKSDSKDGNAFRTRSYTNIVPKSMTRVELMQGYRRLAKKLYSWDSFANRIQEFISNIKRRPQVVEPPLTDIEMKSLQQAGASWPEAEAAIKRIIEHTESTAPFMMRKIRLLTMQHAKHKMTFDDLLPYIDRLVELESTGQLSFDLDDRPVPIPEAFRAIFKRDKLFSNMYNRIYEGLTDKSRVPEALSEVFVDFLSRWGDNFKGIEPQHDVFLSELSDRTCDKFNKEGPGEGQHPQELSQTGPVKPAGLADDVLRNIELQLICKKDVSTSSLERRDANG